MAPDAEMATWWEAVRGEDLGTVTQTQAASDLLMVVKEGQPLPDHSWPSDWDRGRGGAIVLETFALWKAPLRGNEDKS